VNIRASAWISHGHGFCGTEKGAMVGKVPGDREMLRSMHRKVFKSSIWKEPGQPCGAFFVSHGGGHNPGTSMALFDHKENSDSNTTQGGKGGGKKLKGGGGRNSQNQMGDLWTKLFLNER